MVLIVKGENNISSSGTIEIKGIKVSEEPNKNNESFKVVAMPVQDMEW